MRSSVLWLVAALCASCTSLPRSHALAEAPLELAQACDVPLEAVSRPVVRVDLGRGSPRVFLLDSGSSLSVISAACVAELGLPRLPHAAALETKGSSGRTERLADYVRLERLELGALVVRDARMTVMEDTVLARSGVDGILGQDLLARLVLVIDMQRRRLHILPRSGPRPVEAYLAQADVGAGAWARTELQLRPCPFFPVDVRGVDPKLEWKLDTGAVGSSLPRAAIDALGLQQTGSAALATVGGVYTADTFGFDDFDFHGLKVDLDVIESPKKYGLLGMDVLGGLVLVLDGPARTLWLHHRESSRPAQHGTELRKGR